MSFVIRFYKCYAVEFSSTLGTQHTAHNTLSHIVVDNNGCCFAFFKRLLNCTKPCNLRLLILLTFLFTHILVTTFTFLYGIRNRCKYIIYFGFFSNFETFSMLFTVGWALGTDRSTSTCIEVSTLNTRYKNIF